MKNEYEEEMSKKSDEELLDVIGSKQGNYRLEALNAAIYEAKKRNLNIRESLDVSKSPFSKDGSIIEYDQESKKYPTLRFVSSMYKFLAWISLFLTIIFFFYSLSQTDLQMALGIGVIVGGVVSFMTFLALSELLLLFIDIEKNTRKTEKSQKN
jgi:hypothetical protein